ncbi:hypothetical protein C7I84_25550 [Mesorhizobium ephedrae]|uniref:Lytic murein transglycosylase n=1 Tax=Kumtagia ephedrae TaxID=2116701 RepID=A0A2P7RSH1_9HYPH|nr:hypothetical protein C7I84_25550 [Mesorhizobium ephedrae]
MTFWSVAPLRTPLCPEPVEWAGHLARKGGDRLSSLPSPITNVAGRALAKKLPISPLAGEMSGPFDRLRTEGGAKKRRPFLAIDHSPRPC